MFFPQRITSLCLMLTGVWVLAGCGKDEARVAVSGNVTFNGQPLERGSIVFKPNEHSSGPQAATTIADGEYYLDSTNGPGVGDTTFSSTPTQGLILLWMNRMNSSIAKSWKFQPT